MLVAVVVLIALTAFVLRSRLRVPRGVDRGKLGSMSEQWLAEYRAWHAR
jgi:hypothetical protein